MSNEVSADIEAIADDLRYFEALINDDAKSLQARILEAVDATPNPYEHLKAVTGVLVDSQAQLSARVKVLEQALLGKSWPKTTIDALSPRPVAEHNYASQSQVDVSIESFGDGTNMYGIEYTAEGLAYSWSGPAPEIVFDVPVLRDTEKVFRLGFISAMDDDDLLKETQILIDGKSQSVELDFDGQSRGLCCCVPVDEGSRATRIEIKLLRTASPAEQGNGNDQRKLGLAITGYKIT